MIWIAKKFETKKNKQTKEREFLQKFSCKENRKYLPTPPPSEKKEKDYGTDEKFL